MVGDGWSGGHFQGRDDPGRRWNGGHSARGSGSSPTGAGPRGLTGKERPLMAAAHAQGERDVGKLPTSPTLAVNLKLL